VRSKLLLIAVVVIGVFALNTVVQNGLKAMGQVAIKRSQQKH
jgi:hypothetical protein